MIFTKCSHKLPENKTKKHKYKKALKGLNKNGTSIIFN